MLHSDLIMAERDNLLAISPLDGRYARDTESLTPYASEFGLIHARVRVEADLLVAFSDVLPDVEPLGDGARGELTRLVGEFSVADAEGVKGIEKITNHDVKAVELWLRSKLAGDSTFTDYLELVHMGITSEDINNLAHNINVGRMRGDVVLPGLREIGKTLDKNANQYADIPLLALTHGQPATPTTIGKEFRVFEDRLWRGVDTLEGIRLTGKLNGATGGHNALAVAYPEVDWPDFARGFVESYGFEYLPATTQIEPHDSLARIFNEASLVNTILTGFVRDKWAYISRGTFAQAAVETEVGSSTMPHKVNPINFENAEANLGLANAMLRYLADTLPVSRFQRDLRDSSTLRNIGTGFGYSVIAYNAIKRGLARISPNEAAIAAELNEEWGVLGEAVQTVMRRYGVAGGYDKLKAATRGKELDHDGYIALVTDLDLPNDARVRLLALTPATYVGYSAKIAREQLMD